MGREAERRRRRWRFSEGCCAGSAAAEFAMMAPLFLVIIAGIVDFGWLTTKAAALVGTTRIGAEYARLHPADTSGIQNAMKSSTGFSPPLIFPLSFAQSCECDDQSPIACDQSCAALGRRGPNRVFIRISANQAVAPFLPWAGLPATLTSAMEIRLQ